MLAYVLALVVGLSSLALYIAAFFFPEVHRKHDFLWSGLGMFYALVLWVCAGRITGGVLLGQAASVTLLGWLGWQTLALRRQVAPLEQQTAVPTVAEWRTMVAQAWVSLTSAETIAPLAQPISKQVAKFTAWVEALVTTTTNPKAPTPPIEAQPYVPLTPADFANARQDVPPPIATDTTPVQSRKVPAGESPLTAIAKQVQGAFKGLTAKPERKPVYVRKQFRQPEVEPKPAAVNIAAIEVGSGGIKSAPPVEVVDATIVEAEAKLPTSAPQTVDAEVSPDPESTQ